jgi:hypothetical protein
MSLYRKALNRLSSWFVASGSVSAIGVVTSKREGTCVGFITQGLGAAVIGLSLFGNHVLGAELFAEGAARVREIKDPIVRAGVEAAIERNLIPAATEEFYPGYFNITADGRDYGGGATWPGLDSWEMAGAYLELGRSRLVLDYFEFIRASQRNDGAIPIAIFPGTTQPISFLRGLRSPEDVFTYRPPERAGAPGFSEAVHSWIGLFEHWQPKANPLSTLGSVCFILTAAEIYDKTHSTPWLSERFASIESAAKYLLRRKSGNGLIAGSGFYTELPPRYAWDGVTQCYVIHSFRELARLGAMTGDRTKQAKWTAEADSLTQSFIEIFWRSDHFGEYLHPTQGLVDTHGLSDVNWAAVAFEVAAGERLKLLWARLMREPGFWLGDVPTQTVTRPFTYEKWELNEPLPFRPPPQLNDVAAMGRVWYLEAMACRRMQAKDRLVESARKVSEAASNGYWRERYHPNENASISAAGADKYCEYPAVLVRVVLGCPDVFCR